MKNSTLLDRFRRHLLEDGYAPGDRLQPETELAERFNVSRNTIREIIMHLCFSGVLERATSRGTVVRALDVDLLEEDLAFRLEISRYSFTELKETRATIECAILPLVAARMTPEAADRLAKNIDAMEAAADRPDDADMLDKEFHLALLDVCGNRPLRLFSHVISRLFDRSYRGAFLNRDAAMKSVRDHRALLRFLLDHNVDAARELLAAHINAT
ncbi:MAG: FCD domain-containing protein [Phycisphaera sp.]|nr:FCD domain-containing protein [Phycisphaera sp.]